MKFLIDRLKTEQFCFKLCYIFSMVVVGSVFVVVDIFSLLFRMACLRMMIK
jgi:hypothetical protein